MRSKATVRSKALDPGLPSLVFIGPKELTSTRTVAPVKAIHFLGPKEPTSTSTVAKQSKQPISCCQGGRT